MKEALSILTIVTVLLYAVLTMAHDKVVVIPLNKKLDIDKDCLDVSGTKDSEGNWTFVCDTKRVFVSSTYSNGNLGGLVGADDQCNALASGAGLKGTFKAWLSDSHTSVLSRFNMNPRNVYRRTDGKIIANSPDDLLDGTIDLKIEYDENSLKTTYPNAVWTGSLGDGSRDSTSEKCGGWLEAWGTLKGGYGSIQYSTTASKWTYIADTNCELTNARIYCFEQ